jgi:hypothetical protein
MAYLHVVFCEIRISARIGVIFYFLGLNISTSTTAFLHDDNVLQLIFCLMILV